MTKGSPTSAGGSQAPRSPVHSRAPLVFRVPPALLGKRESEEPEVNLDPPACPDPLASAYVPLPLSPPAPGAYQAALNSPASSPPTGWTWQPWLPRCRWCVWPQGELSSWQRLAPLPLVV